jgi:hypothetical protein
MPPWDCAGRQTSVDLLQLLERMEKSSALILLQTPQDRFGHRVLVGAMPQAVFWTQCAAAIRR